MSNLPTQSRMTPIESAAHPTVAMASNVLVAPHMSTSDSAEASGPRPGALLVVENAMALAQVPKPPRGLSRIGMIAATGLYVGSLAAMAVTSSGGLIAGGVAVLASIPWWLPDRREARTYEREAVAARDALHRGQLAHAQAVFWRWAEQARTATVAAQARLDLGMTLVQRGDHARAIAILEAIRKNYREVIDRSAKTSQTAVWLAYAHALHGDGDAARASLDPATRGKGNDALATFVEALIRCRAGESAEAANLLDEQWLELEAALTGRQLRAVRIVRAFAHSAAGPRAAGTAASILLGIRPSYPGEFAFLGADWPEMEAFLATHELGG